MLPNHTTRGSSKKKSNPNSDTPGLAGWREPSLRPRPLSQPFLSYISDPEQHRPGQRLPRDSRPEPGPGHLSAHQCWQEGAQVGPSDTLTWPCPLESVWSGPCARPGVKERQRLTRWKRRELGSGGGCSMGTGGGRYRIWDRSSKPWCGTMAGMGG